MGIYCEGPNPWRSSVRCLVGSRPGKMGYAIFTGNNFLFFNSPRIVLKHVRKNTLSLPCPKKGPMRGALIYFSNFSKYENKKRG